MRPSPTLNEEAMLSAELRIPQLAAQAGRAAHQRATANPSSSLVMTSASGQLVKRVAGDGGTVVIKTLPASTPARPGTVLTRASRLGPKAGGR